MDKFDFINRIVALYPHAIKDQEAQYDTYKRALPISEKVDYEEVYNIFCTEHKDSFPPPPALIKEWATRCIRADYKNKKFVHFAFRDIQTGKVIRNCASDVPMSPEQGLKWIKAVSHSDNWEVAEVY